MEQFTGYMVPENQQQNNDMFVFNTTLSQGPLNLGGYDEFMSFTYPGVTANSDATDTSTSNNLFSSMQSMDMHGNDPQFSPLVVGNGQMFRQHHNMSHAPNQPPTPPDTTPRTTNSVPASPPGMQLPFTPERRPSKTPIDKPATPDDALTQMVELLAQPDAWHGLPDGNSDSSQTLSHDARDRIVATVQVLLQRALQSRYSPTAPSQGLFGRIVVLPPSHVLMHFIDTYASRIDSIQPYLGLAGSSIVNIQDILQIDMADVGILLIILLIAQGAMLTDDPESQILANGLIEVCRIALDDVLESRSISQQMIGGIALQLLTLCARSGKDSFTSYAMSKRGQYLSMLKCTGVLQSEQTLHNPKSDGMELWERWKELEQRNRHAYAWVYVDLEISLLHDLPPILSVNDLQVPLPQDNELWHAQSYSAWLELSGVNGTRPGPCNPAKFGAWLEQQGASETRSGHMTPSLNGLFRSFLQGRMGDDLPLHHLRLLLHPLQAMVLEQQQLLRIFDTDEPSNRYRVLSKIKILGRLQETQDLLQDLGTLLTRRAQTAAVEDEKGQLHSTDFVSMIMLHLVSLNVFTSIPEIEKCAKEVPPASDATRAEMWRWARYPEGESYVLFHAGQIFRLIDGLSVDARPTWWPVALYRAAMSCWSLRSFERPTSSACVQALEVCIDALLPAEEECFLNTTTGTPVVTLVDKRRLPILEGGNSLQYCISKLETHPTHCSRNVLEKARYFLNRWR
ncbi:hypothetical protein G6011_09381 [Alternaria panax]|uniref:Xylanolytic transcriptional activator regulatory domain-containing protein n=1 Tax=Alternaria panax TaxID=48097 RepID=A0AAD4IB63_9PLEO|nr:hypothetical protein G6011_09381 [Alternaria panax]